jgi:hypothetical protein
MKVFRTAKHFDHIYRTIDGRKAWVDFQASDFLEARTRIDRDHVVASFTQHPQNPIAKLGFIRAGANHSDGFDRL